ncbi:hypothetical protein [Nocardia otitidiscaviarum]|uniref:hypothetical protein n=1 Tax=Nocardia otitidiscaviarum TaxID=1823 RepID=UPI000B184825|nr:hypothetical protein [Nocardia otitidiscaviarum]
MAPGDIPDPRPLTPRPRPNVARPGRLDETDRIGDPDTVITVRPDTRPGRPPAHVGPPPQAVAPPPLDRPES